MMPAVLLGNFGLGHHIMSYDIKSYDMCMISYGIILVFGQHHMICRSLVTWQKRASWDRLRFESKPLWRTVVCHLMMRVH